MHSAYKVSSAIACMCMEKQAKISGAKLMKLTGGVRPLFHMTDKINAPSLLKHKKIYTPTELGMRGIKSPSIEGTLGRARHSISSTVLPEANDVGGKAVIKFKDIARETLPPGDTMYKRLFLRNVGATKYRGPTRHYALANIANYPRGSYGAKNYDTISFAPKPLKSYGDVGVMVNPNKSKYPVSSGGNENFMMPKVIQDKGVPSAMELPSASGTLLYSPKDVSREMAKQFKEQGGVALNSRFYRKLKGISKSLKNQNTVDLEGGNNAIMGLKYRNRPAYDKFYDKVMPGVDDYYKEI